MLSDIAFLYPKISTSTEKFWKGLKERKLLAQKCKKCGERFFPPRARCPECLSDKLDWVELSGKGELYSWSEVYMPPLAFGDSFILGIIDLEEKVGRIITRIEVEPEKLVIGMELAIDYVDVTETLTLCVFKPV